MADATKLGLSEEMQEKAEAMKDFPPTLDTKAVMPEGVPVKLEIVEDDIKVISHKDKETGDDLETPAIIVKGVDGIKRTLWLSAISLRLQVHNLIKKHKNLLGLNVLLSVRVYDHPKYGKNTRAYRLDAVEN